MDKKLIKCNSFDGSPGGGSGAISYQAPLGTHTAPNSVQDPKHFARDNYNQYYDKNKSGQPDMGNVQDQSGSFDKDVDQMFKRKEGPTPDEITTGIRHELSNMVRKDKRMAKQSVVQNLKKDPKYYSGLHMMNIDEPSLTMNMNENEKLNPLMQERVNVLNQMVQEKKDKRMETNSAILDILQEKRDQKNERINTLIKFSL